MNCYKIHWTIYSSLIDLDEDGISEDSSTGQTHMEKAHEMLKV